MTLYGRKRRGRKIKSDRLVLGVSVCLLLLSLVLAFIGSFFWAWFFGTIGGLGLAAWSYIKNE